MIVIKALNVNETQLEEIRWYSWIKFFYSLYIHLIDIIEIFKLKKDLKLLQQDTIYSSYIQS